MLHHQIHSALTGGMSTEPTRRTPSPTGSLLLSAAVAALFVGMSLRKFHQTRPILPEPVVIGPRHVRWRRADLVAWAQALPTVGVREEPAQLRAGRAAKKVSADAFLVDGLVDCDPPAAETQAGRGVGHLVSPSNPKSTHAEPATSVKATA